MRAFNGSILLAATDLVNFLGCPHATFLDRHSVGEPATKAEDDPYLKLLQEKGLEHEHQYLDQLRAQGKRIEEIADNLSFDERVAKTQAALAGGADVVYQGALLGEGWHGYADFLVREQGSSRLGPYLFEPVDTKLSRSAKPKHAIQLSVYAWLLAAQQGASPPRLHVALGDGTYASLAFGDVRYYFDVARRRLEAFLLALPATSAGQPCPHCGQCDWRDKCESDWEASDHLTLVANINRSQTAKLEAVGVTTMAALAGLADGFQVPNLQAATLARLRSQARLQVAKRTDGQNRHEVLPLVPQKGFGRLPPPSAGDLFFDMEGNPLFDGGLEYLFGFVFRQKNEPVFRSFWGHDRAGEKKAFEGAVDFIAAQLKAFPDAHIYHYAQYEETALKRLAMLHGTRENEIDDLLRQERLVDLHQVVKDAIRVSEPSYSLKNIEKFYMKDRGEDVKTAMESVVVYEKWRRVRDDLLLQQIASYNETDCRSTLHLRDWLISLKPSAVPWFDGIKLKPPDPKRQEKRLEAERQFADTKERLVRGAPQAALPFRELVGQLLEFHRREAKPEYWAMFRRQKQAEEELIDDADCIGALRKDPNSRPRPIARSLIHTFTFPVQDYKLRVGSTPLQAATLAPAGEIVELDEETCRVGLKIGNKAPPFEDAFSLIPSGPINFDGLRDAVYRYAEAIIAGDDRYAAVTSILRRESPRMAGRERGTPIVTGDAVETAAGAIGALDRSHMLVQGPPGTGKTYLSAHTIVDLLIKGKRVGVASNSHKAVNNLLLEIERQAKERGFSFKGVKKCSEEDHRCNGKMILDVFKNEEVGRHYKLVGGTAWLFARPEFDQHLDYLFVDEAGQVSLANVVAMGVSARNIVLVGDQMQLAQPIKGDHPGETGVSGLEYVLQDRATVPPESGIFLGITRRMHPDVCEFISQAVYEGRLHAEEPNRKQRLILDAGAHEVLRPSGLCFVPVAHQDCSQKSEEEGARIAEIYSSLLRLSWIDRDSKQRPIDASEILVVSPYNVQVNYLKTLLPLGARVGTVDKFQGQEAAVVLISMTTSSTDDMPRNMEFLYSRNRLNVAISRARALAVVVASPQLLEAPCNRIEQMRLVNTLCFAKAYAEDSSVGR
jgi:uncharacterized protein